MEWSALFGFLGAVIGGICSIVGSKWATKENIAAQNEAMNKERELEKQQTKQNEKNNARIIYYDLLSALHEAFMYKKNVKRPGIGNSPYTIPMFKEYSNAIISLSNDLSPIEVISLYKIYGIIEKVRYDIIQTNVNRDKERINNDMLALLSEAYKEKYEKVWQYDQKHITKDCIVEELRPEYKEIFNKLASIGKLNKNC